jgi:GT2 family glycosyltransferase
MSVYVVDNDSTDGSIEQLRQIEAYGKLEVIKNEENRGFAAANNQILNTVPSDYYVLINPDCKVQPDTVSKVLDAMEQDERIGLASCLIRDPDGTIQESCRRRFPTPWSGFVRILGLHHISRDNPMFANFDLGGQQMGNGIEFVEAISGAFMVARGEAIRAVGVLDEDYFMHCEDLDWCMRFWKSGYKVAFVPGVEVTHAKGGSSGSKKWLVNWHLHRGMIRFYSKFYKEKYPLPIMWLVFAGVGLRFVVKSTNLLYVSLTSAVANKT